MFSWQFYNNQVKLEGLKEEQQILRDITGNSPYVEKLHYGNRKNVLEAYENIRKKHIFENEPRHQAITSSFEIIQEITQDSNITMETLYLDEGLIEVKGFVRKKTAIDKHFIDLDLPHYGLFGPVEYVNYLEDRYQFIIKNNSPVKGESRNE